MNRRAFDDWGDGVHRDGQGRIRHGDCFGSLLLHLLIVMLDDKKDECKGRAGVLACALKGPTEVGTTNHLPNSGPFFMYCYLSGYVGISTDIYKDENTTTCTFLVAFTTPSLSRIYVRSCNCTFPLYQGIYSYTFLHHFGSGIEIWIVLSMYWTWVVDKAEKRQMIGIDDSRNQEARKINQSWVANFFVEANRLWPRYFFLQAWCAHNLSSLRKWT